MCNESECGHKKDENGCAIFGVAVNFSGNPDQTKQPSGFEKSDQSGGLGKKFHMNN